MDTVDARARAPRHPLAPEWLHTPADPNALADGVWPDSAERGEDGGIRIAGVPVAELVREHGTPLYVVDEADLETPGEDEDAEGAEGAEGESAEGEDAESSEGSEEE